MLTTVVVLENPEAQAQSGLERGRPSTIPSPYPARPRCTRVQDQDQRKQDEVQVLEESIRQRSEQHKKAGVELDATCHICLKTKFADGVGHVCNYCNIRCCARCGGKVTLRSNKVSTSTSARRRSRGNRDDEPVRGVCSLRKEETALKYFYST
ncbi:Rab-3-interacting molecule unc-10 [Frankliniella fusca]|uniref:Rab-3-interacting molecule unc-10 n=1 Tax=Frankliniella fusca TaxID=407009 RepID=A0AAE1I3T8_9NEOP|nr:Rab-3-interacting molecule unc-10 [Frankliniella fusca]